MIVGIVGTRDKRHDILWPVVNREISKLPTDTIVATGDNPHGVDWLTREIATELGYQLVVFHARWAALRKAAGPERNGNLVAYIDRLIAIPSPTSIGTWSAVNLCKKAQKPWTVVASELPSAKSSLVWKRYANCAAHLYDGDRKLCPTRHTFAEARMLSTEPVPCDPLTASGAPFGRVCEMCQKRFLHYQRAAS